MVWTLTTLLRMFLSQKIEVLGCGEVCGALDGVLGWGFWEVAGGGGFWEFGVGFFV